jgi:hypothetical protein
MRRLSRHVTKNFKFYRGLRQNRLKILHVHPRIVLKILHARVDESFLGAKAKRVSIFIYRIEVVYCLSFFHP